MRRFPLIAIPALLLVLLVNGCASDIRSENLTTTLARYASVMRWGDFASAEQFVDPKVREEHPMSSIDMSRFSQVRVSSYDDGDGPAASGENEARQVVQIGLINLNTQAGRTVIDKQLWRYDPEKKQWWLMTGLPNISQ
jgi:hypothetical protein